LDIRENDNGTVTFDGLTIGGFIADGKTCPFCSESPTIYFVTVKQILARTRGAAG